MNVNSFDISGWKTVMAAAFIQFPKFLLINSDLFRSRVIYLPIISHYFPGLGDGGGREPQEMENNIRTAILVS